MHEVKNTFSNKFKMKDLGKLSYFLGMNFEIGNDYISMSQENYISKLLNKFDMVNCKPKSHPCELSLNKDLLNITVEKLPESLHNNYRAIIGSIIYVMLGTRPDLSFIITKLSQYLSNPTNYHLKVAKNVLKYLKHSLNYKIIFRKSQKLDIFGYCDSDFGGSEDRFSISGYCFKLSENGPLISWKSKKQNIVALSSCEAEYVSLTSAIQEANFLRQLFADMQFLDKPSVTIFVDNQSAISLAKNPVFHQRTKHIDIKFHYIRNDIKNKNVSWE